MKRNSMALVIAAVAVAATITYLKVHKMKVENRNNAELDTMVQFSSNAAKAKNLQAVHQCETNINTILVSHFRVVYIRGQIAAEDIATYGSCCNIIYVLAKDKLRGSDATGLYVKERLQGGLGDSLKELSQDLETSISQLELSLRKNTVGLAQDLAQLNPHNRTRTLAMPAVDLKTDSDINRALMCLGLNGVTVGVVIPLDVWSVLSSKIVKTLVSKISVAAARMFARPAAAAAAEVIVAGADGPLPFGDIIAVIGGLYTTYDVYSTQKQFENEMKQSMANILPDAFLGAQKQVLEQVYAILKDHQGLQAKICQISVQEFAK